MGVLDKICRDACRLEIPLAPAFNEEAALILKMIDIDNENAFERSLGNTCLHKWCIMVRSMRIVLGLGSNIGDREGRLRQAIASLRKRRVDALRSASLYLTEPRDFEDQPWFINTVVEVETELNPANLLEQCLAVEQEAVRMRDQSRGPRPIDIDILFYN